MTDLPHNFEGEQQHPPQDQFLLYVDGELPSKEISRWESHLDACWSCRVRVAKIEETITEIIEFEDTISQFQFSRATHNWGNFDSRLNAVAMEAGQHLNKTRFFDFWRRLRRFRDFNLSVRVAVPSLAALLIVAIVYQFIVPPTVSASELLKLSVEAQAQRIKETDQPVLHQRIRVVGTGSGSDRVNPVTWEIWNDTVNSRVKISSPPYEGGVASASDDGVVLSDLQSILRTNRMNEHRPLSAASYQSWTNSLAGKREEVTRDGETLTIHTVPAEPIATGGITEARLVIRTSDYHPTTLYLKARTAEGEQGFELVEQDFQIVSLMDVDPSVFGEGPVVAASPDTPMVAKTDPSASPADSPADTANTNTDVSAPAVKATTEVEVEVLDLLHKVGADITEQLNVTRTADGRLLVEGLVETAARKQEILNALAPVRNNPAIRIKVQTLEEATRALQRQKQQATPPSVERVEVEKGTLAVYTELRAYFERNGGNADEQIRQFASRVIGRSQSAGFQASALNRMANRFSGEQLKALEPAARSKWLGILKGYAAAVRRETAALRGELQPVFGGMGDGATESVTSDADLIASARRLYELASANERVIRSAFTISSGGMSVSALKSAQFRRSLGQAEALAAAIERAR